jgi:hypothetical protein
MNKFNNIPEEYRQKMEYAINQAVDKIQASNVTILTQVDSLLKEQKNFIGDILKDTVNKIEEKRTPLLAVQQFQLFNSTMIFMISFLHYHTDEPKLET